MVAADFWLPRQYLLKPIPEIFEAAAYLNDAVTAHLAGDARNAEALLKKADMPILYEWTESLWGKVSPEIHRFRKLENRPAPLAAENRIQVRMPNATEQTQVIARDGYYCCYCNIPVIRREVREKLKSLYPQAVPWGRKNREQHAALQCMWLTYDHVVPHSHGGQNSVDNVIVSCQPCNCAKMQYLLEELGLTDPRLNSRPASTWDGLERIFTR